MGSLLEWVWPCRGHANSPVPINVQAVCVSPFCSPGPKKGGRGFCREEGVCSGTGMGMALQDKLGAIFLSRGG